METHHFTLRIPVITPGRFLIPGTHTTTMFLIDNPIAEGQ